MHLCDTKGNLMVWTHLMVRRGCYYNMNSEVVFVRVFSKDKALIDVRAIYEDDHHTIWIGTSEGRL